ncbi:hypothetical protein BgAZ_502790 [Babesia gibsoni]|uniref:Uncharacterized protein n=1 Tax=Babesia gibsoni TaxID=33632 RepID=A0AAD8PD91_BABGI|nr:hypothetical protein BgAZ_502790 [Babesia gibsoni]
MWRFANSSFSRYSIELSEILCKCLKDPFRDKALARYALNVKKTNYVNGTPQPIEAGEHVPFTSFNQLMDSNTVPLPIARIFSLNDSNDARVCILNNVFSNHEETPPQCTCSFSRLREIEFQCVNELTTNGLNCSKNICETCCVISLSSTVAKEGKHAERPVNCKIRCANSPVISDITQDSQQFLSEYYRMINALYHPEAPSPKQRDEKDVPTQYHVIPLKDERDDTF